LLGAYAACSGNAPETPRASQPKTSPDGTPTNTGEAGAVQAGGGEANASEPSPSASTKASSPVTTKPTSTKPTTGTGGTSTVTTEPSEEAGQGGATFELPRECDSDTQLPPTNLVCTGLFADITSKLVAPGVEAYAPAVPLWSDGAEKQRWIELPPDTTIDNSDPSEWMFPIGTKVWKEFSRAGRRVETRLWHKVDTNYWVDATYAWNADETAATRSAGGDFTLPDGSSYHIPTPDECQDCHRGRTDRILGFEQTLLGLAGATGYNLERLSAEGRLSNPPAATTLTIGDDGTALAAPALAWLHVNCGTTCHNRNSNAMAWSTGLFMRLDPTELDARAVNAFDTLTTTIGVAAVTPAWSGRTRIAAGDPAHSLLYDLITHRGTGQQMPPIATNVVDEADVPLVEAWITELPHSSAGATGSGGFGGMAQGGASGREGGSGGHGMFGNGGTGGHGAGTFGGVAGIAGANAGTSGVAGGGGVTSGGGGAPSDQSGGNSTAAGSAGGGNDNGGDGVGLGGASDDGSETENGGATDADPSPDTGIVI
jgi:hypothetical protein